MDNITRSVTIKAPIDLVYTAVAHPGWYISDDDGDTTGQELRPVPGGHMLVDARYGQFYFRQLSENPPHTTSHQCVFYPLNDPDPDLSRTDSTTCSFELRATDAGTELTVTEADVHKLGLSAADAEAFIVDNGRGWETKLGHLKRQLEEAE